MKSLAALVVLAKVLAGVAGAAPIPGAPQSGEQIFHIELNTLPGCYQSGCDNLFSNFGDKDVTAFLNGRQYPVQVIRRDKPDFPTHLLVVFAAGVKRPGNTELANRLNKPLSKGWLVSVARKDGSFTPYCGKDTLARALARTSATSLSDTGGESGLNEAIETLEDLPGRRVFLLVNEQNRPLPKWVSDAAEALALVYVVDGGDRKRVYFATLDGGGTVFVQGENWKTVTKRVFHEGVMHEVKLSSAMKDIVSDSRYDYDLSFSMPTSQADYPVAPLAVRVELMTRRVVTASGYAIAIPDSLRAGLYTVANKEMGGSESQTRIAVPQDLSVVWRCSFGRYPTVLLHIAGEPSHKVLPHATKPDGTVLISYSAADTTTAADYRRAAKASVAAPQTLKIEQLNRLGTVVPHLE